MPVSACLPRNAARAIANDVRAFAGLDNLLLDMGVQRWAHRTVLKVPAQVLRSIAFHRLGAAKDGRVAEDGAAADNAGVELFLFESKCPGCAAAACCRRGVASYIAGSA